MQTLYLLCFAILLSCAPKKENTANVREELMKFHDQLMMDNDALIGNQMKLDTLLRDLKGLKAKNPTVDTAQEKVKINTLLARLTTAEDRMNDWMHNFNADFKGSSPELSEQYFEAERSKIAAIAKLYQQEIDSSTAYLNQYKK